MNAQKKNYLGEYLKALGITQEAAGEIVSVQKAAINKIVKGTRDLRPDYAKKLWRQFGLPEGDWQRLYDEPPDDNYLSQSSLHQPNVLTTLQSPQLGGEGPYSEQEQAVIDLWRALSREQRKSLIGFLEATVSRFAA